MMPSLGSISLRAQLRELRETCIIKQMCISLLKGMIQDTDEQSDGCLTRGGLGGSQAQELLSLWSWGASPSWHVNVLTNLKALPTPYYWDFMEASSRRHDQFLTVSSPSPLSEGWGAGYG